MSEINRYDDQNSSLFVKTFKEAWSACCTDYDERIIDSEGTLQAALYHHLRSRLNPEQFVVFSEFSGKLSIDDSNKSNKLRVVVDLVVCQKHSSYLELIGAIEVKYKPRGRPSEQSVQKDMHSLSMMTRRRSNDSAIDIAVERHHDGQTVRISSVRKLVYAGIYQTGEGEDHPPRLAEDFWVDAIRPTHGRWANSASIPPNLIVAIGEAPKPGSNGTLITHIFGDPIVRLTEQTQ
ncbi:MAG TPA: hypothetical protein VK141_10705 [Nitrosomonas sp.]|nr:hypothetical protein [Nitrosomonas sp.]